MALAVSVIDESLVSDVPFSSFLEVLSSASLGLSALHHEDPSDRRASIEEQRFDLKFSRRARLILVGIASLRDEMDRERVPFRPSIMFFFLSVYRLLWTNGAISMVHTWLSGF